MTTLFESYWLHLTDLHVGMNNQGWLWPELKSKLYDDLDRLGEKLSKLDFVIFSGDLVQKGSEIEYNRLTEILEDIWSRFALAGSNPQLIHIPGNHDIVRPDVDDPLFLLLSKWWENPELHNNFFEGKYGYKSAIEKLFHNYLTWSENIEKSGIIPIAPYSKGILPGDKAVSLEIRNHRIGIIGLNSTWLQFASGNQEGKLTVDPRQLHALTESDPREWCDENDFNLIVTHHPISWLGSLSQKNWNNEINPAGRFDLHLFGHMHEASSETSSQFGSDQRTILQGASLFGLEYIEDKTFKRSHGYSLARIRQSTIKAEMHLWPRAMRVIGSGENRLGPDNRFDLAEDNSILLYQKDVSTEGQKKKTLDELTSLPSPSTGFALEDVSIINSLRYYLPDHKHHQNLRKLEQEDVKQAFLSDRLCWISSEWGMASDEFLGTVLDSLNPKINNCFRVEVSGGQSAQSFLTAIKSRYGLTLDRICQSLAEAGDCCLIIDDLPTREGSKAGTLSLEEELENIAAISLQYCDNMVVILRSRLNPLTNKKRSVIIREFDDVDLLTYVKSHNAPYIDIKNENSVRTLHRHTDGVPVKVDAALTDLAVVPLSELVNSNSDLISHSAFSQSPVPSNALYREIQDLSSKADTLFEGAFDLLKALSVFPKGEQLIRIKRFKPNRIFYSHHATELIKRRLIENTTTPPLDTKSFAEASRVLVVPRLVRESLRPQISTTEYQDLNNKAAELYFGMEWPGGVFKPSSGYKFDNPHCGTSDISNANAIIVRIVRDAFDYGGEREINSGLGLTITYTHALIRGDHFSGAVTLLGDVTGLIPSSLMNSRIAQLHSLHLQVLRMVGDYSSAIVKSKEVDIDELNIEQKQSYYLNLVLTYESIHETTKVDHYASKCMELNPKSSKSWQVKSIVLRQRPPSVERDKKLRQLEAYCRKNKAFQVANEIALSRADESSLNVEQIARILEPVIESTTESQNFYIRIRAFLRIMKLKLDNKEDLTSIEAESLVKAYHYLSNERLSLLFDKCHELLWVYFINIKSYDGLAKLFRNSSLHWRLRGKAKVEEFYLDKAQTLISSASLDENYRDKREFKYLRMRVETNMKVPIHIESSKLD